MFIEINIKFSKNKEFANKFWVFYIYKNSFKNEDRKITMHMDDLRLISDKICNLQLLRNLSLSLE